LNTEGEIEIDQAEGRTTKQARDKYFRMKKIMKELSEKMELVPKEEFVKECSFEFTTKDIEVWLLNAKRDGDIIEVRHNMFNLIKD